MYIRKGSKSGCYELQSINNISNTSINSHSSMTKTHKRRPSYVPTDTKIMMIDESLSGDIGIITPKTQTTTQGTYSSEQTLISAETGGSPSSNNYSSNLSGHAIPYKPDHRSSKCCRYFCYICSFMVVILLIAIIAFILSVFGYLQHWNTNNVTITSTTESLRNKPSTLPQIIEISSSTSTSKFPSTVTSTKQKTESDLPIYKGQRTFGFKNTDNLPLGEVLMSPMAYDYTFSVLANHVKDQANFRYKYFDKFDVSSVKEHYSTIFEDLSRLDNNFNDIYFYGNGASNDSIKSNEIRDKFDKYNVIYVNEEDLQTLKTSSNEIISTFNDKSQINSHFGYGKNFPEKLNKQFFGVNNFNFAMKFKNEMDTLSKPGMTFYTADFKTISITKQLVAVDGYRKVSGDQQNELLAIPLENDNVVFFIYKGILDSNKHKLPVINFGTLIFYLRSLDTLKKIEFAIPPFKKSSISSINQVLTKNLPKNICVDFPLNTTDCVKLLDVFQLTRFHISAKGINIHDSSDKDYKETGQFKNLNKPSVYDVDRPFYYGIWYKGIINNEPADGFLYLGSYLG